MNTQAPDRTRSGTERISMRQIWLAGALAVVGAVLANILIRIIVVSQFDIAPEFDPLASNGPLVTLTVVGVVAATIVLALLTRFTSQPIRNFWIVALVALVLSFLPTLSLRDDPDAQPAAIIGLMVMHVVAAAIAVALLTTVPRQR